MEIGDIAGKGTVYDEFGKAIVHPDEALLDFFKAKSRSWVAEYQEMLREVNLSKAEKLHFEGEFTVTNKRILFLAKPRDFADESISGGVLGNFPDDIVHVMKRSNIAKEEEARLYLQVGWEEIDKVKIGPVNSYVYLKLAGEKPLRFIFDKESGKRLRYIVGKMLNNK